MHVDALPLMESVDDDVSFVVPSESALSTPCAVVAAYTLRACSAFHPFLRLCIAFSLLCRRRQPPCFAHRPPLRSVRFSTSARSWSFPSPFSLLPVSIFLRRHVLGLEFDRLSTCFPPFVPPLRPDTGRRANGSPVAAHRLLVNLSTLSPVSLPGLVPVYFTHHDLRASR